MLLSTWYPRVDISIHISSTCWVGGGGAGGRGGGQNTLLDNRNYKITNKGYAANLTLPTFPSFFFFNSTYLC